MTDGFHIFLQNKKQLFYSKVFRIFILKKIQIHNIQVFSFNYYIL